jgi:uncharacterized membrane protein
MREISESVIVDAPISAVYDQWTQFESFPEFMGGVERVEQLEDTRVRWTATLGGVRRAFKQFIEDVQEPTGAWRGEIRHGELQRGG